MDHRAGGRRSAAGGRRDAGRCRASARCGCPSPTPRTPPSPRYRRRRARCRPARCGSRRTSPRSPTGRCPPSPTRCVPRCWRRRSASWGWWWAWWICGSPGCWKGTRPPRHPPPAAPAGGPSATPETGDRTGATQEGPAGIAAVARDVAGVARLAPVLGGLSRPLRFSDGHVLIQLATAPGHRALDVACAVRRAVAAAPAAPSTVAVLVTRRGTGMTDRGVRRPGTPVIAGVRSGATPPRPRGRAAGAPGRPVRRAAAPRTYGPRHRPAGPWSR